MADRRWRGAVFDLGVGLVFVAVLSGPIIWAAGVVHRGVKYGLRLRGCCDAAASS